MKTIQYGYVMKVYFHIYLNWELNIDDFIFSKNIKLHPGEPFQ